MPTQTTQNQNIEQQKKQNKQVYDWSIKVVRWILDMINRQDLIGGASKVAIVKWFWDRYRLPASEALKLLEQAQKNPRNLVEWIFLKEMEKRQKITTAPTTAATTIPTIPPEAYVIPGSGEQQITTTKKSKFKE